MNNFTYSFGPYSWGDNKMPRDLSYWEVIKISIFIIFLEKCNRIAIVGFFLAMLGVFDIIPMPPGIILGFMAILMESPLENWQKINGDVELEVKNNSQTGIR